MSANDRTGVGHGSGEWETPDEIYRPADRRYQFTFDAAASHRNAKTATYATVDGVFRRRNNSLLAADETPLQLSAQDGLDYPWADERVWLNAPYTSGLVEPFVTKMIDERNRAEIINAILPAATETRWFQRAILPLCHIDWLPQRVRFIHPPFPCGERCPAGAPGPDGRPRHAFGEPGDSPPGGHVLVLPKCDWERRTGRRRPATG